MVIVGASGRGKTTLLNMIGELDRHAVNNGYIVTFDCLNQKI